MAQDEMQGLVIKSTGSWVTVETNGRHYPCKVRGNLRMEGIESTSPVVVGDIVRFRFQEKDRMGLITGLADRKNYIVRRAIKQSRRKHILAANIDLAMLVITLKSPRTATMFADRFLVTAEAYKIPAMLVVNKLDLYKAKQMRQLGEWERTYNLVGYEVLAVSAQEGTGLDALKEKMKDKTSLVAGNSGVGKSTLLNQLSPGLGLKTAEISDAHKTGKHTTTFSELFTLGFGGKIIDTPGIKGFGLVDISEKELGLYFPEMFRFLPGCQFYNCTHTHEPNCAVKQAVEDGEIPASRYYNYLEMLENPDEKYRGNKYG